MEPTQPGYSWRPIGFGEAHHLGLQCSKRFDD
jgi:hypothetical protein